MVAEKGMISVLAFGADRTGATASDAAFQAAFQMFCASRATWTYADALSNMATLVPPGQYAVTNSEAVIPSGYTTKTTGYCLKGTDRSLCNIIFAPTTGSKVLVYNQAFLFSRMENLTFVGTGRDQTFYRADMTANNQQGWIFDNCAWLGCGAKASTSPAPTTIPNTAGTTAVAAAKWGNSCIRPRPPATRRDRISF
jgi:hypothetical protein